MSPVFRGLWVGVALMFLSVGLSFDIAHAAETTSSEFPQLLSYSQIMSLTPRKREIYIDGVRKMLIELSKASAKQKSNFFAGRDEEHNGYLALLNTILPAATAADNLPPEAAIVPDMEKEHNNRPFCDPTKRIFAQSIKDRDGKEFWYCANDRTDNSSCPAGFVPVDQGISGKFKCATIASFEALNQAVQTKLRQLTNSKDETLAKAFAALPASTAAKIGPVTCTEPLLPFEFSSSTGCIQPKPYGDSFCPDTFVAVSQKADGSFMCMSSESFNRFSEEDRKKLRKAYADHTGSGERTVNFLNSNGKQTGGPAAEDKKTTVAADTGSQCKPVALECKKAANSEEFAKYRTEFYKSNAPHKCIYAGSISSYYGPAKAPGKCMPPGPLSMNAAQAAAKMEGDGYWSCTGKGVLCNPLLFGVKKDSNQPFCASPRTVGGKGPTEQCDAMSTPEARVMDFLDWKDPGIQEQWNSFRAGFNSLCKENEASRNFHCTECGVIAKRLPEINKLVFNNCDGPGESAPAPAGSGVSKPGPAPGPGHH